MKKDMLLWTLATLISLQAFPLRCEAAPPARPSTSSAVIQEDRQKKAELVDTLLTEQGYLVSQLVDKCFTFNWSASTWDAFNKPGNPNEMGKGSMAFWIQDVTKYAKRQGFDFYTLEVDDKEVEKQNRPMIDDMVKQFSQKFSLTVNSSNECRGKAYEMTMRYPWEVLQRLGHFGPDWDPKGGEIHVTVNLSPTAKDISVAVSPDYKKVTVAGPIYTEAYDTQNKISNGLERVNKNR